MADAGHLESLTTWTTERWNSERPENPDLNEAHLHRANLHRANLSKANLREANLRRANLRRANLNGANLRRANLSGANLYEANLYRANLSGANLSGANLYEANLSGANLSGANLSGANLSGANLSEANLSGADLSGANLSVANLTWADLGGTNLSGADLSGAMSGSTVWGDLDLRDVVGLDQLNHYGPSTVGVDTLYQSEGRIPPEFLRGCGLPEYFIGMIPGLTVTAPIQHFSVFVSYNHTDQAAALKIYDHLFHANKIPTWLDKHEIEAGDKLMRSVDQAIRRVDKVILLCSEASLNSWWIEQEILRWTRKEDQLRKTTGEPVSMVIPVDLDGHLYNSDNEHAATILATAVLPAQDWDTNDEILANVNTSLVRALRRDRRSPFETLAQRATEI